jgi:hypothetical protein
VFVFISPIGHNGFQAHLTKNAVIWPIFNALIQLNNTDLLFCDACCHANKIHCAHFGDYSVKIMYFLCDYQIDSNSGGWGCIKRGVLIAIQSMKYPKPDNSAIAACGVSIVFH